MSIAIRRSLRSGPRPGFRGLLKSCAKRSGHASACLRAPHFRFSQGTVTFGVLGIRSKRKQFRDFTMKLPELLEPFNDFFVVLHIVTLEGITRSRTDS